MSEDIKHHEKKVIAKVVTIILIIMASALLLFVYLVSTIKSSRTSAIRDNQNSSFERVYAELQLLRTQAYDNCKNITDDMEYDLRQLDLEKIKADMDNGYIGEEIYDVIEKHTKGVSLNNINNYKNGITVMTQDGVLEDFNYERSADKKIRTWESEIENAWNKELEKDAIDKILIHASKRLIAMEKNDMGHGHMKINEMTKANLKKVYLAEGIEGLRNYQFKVACYITETGDIFGQEDIVRGIQQKTHKIIVVQEFNLYDQLQQLSPDLFESSVELVEIERRYSMISSITYILGLFFISTVITLLFYFSHMYNYYIWVYSNAESEESDENRAVFKFFHK